MTALCIVALLIALLMLRKAWSILMISRNLNRDQRNGYKLNRSAPTWLEGKK